MADSLEQADLRHSDDALHVFLNPDPEEGGYTVTVPATAGEETYGAGRYLTDTIKGTWGRGLAHQGGRVVLDFNYAYNPSCAYNSRWACPLAPPENHLEGAVRAGELAYPDPA